MDPKMNEVSILNRANLFESGLFSWGIPEQTAKELTRHHTELCYAPGRLVFSQGSPGDIVIVAAFAQMEEAAARRHSPAVVHVDERNRQRQGFPLRQAV